MRLVLLLVFTILGLDAHAMFMAGIFRRGRCPELLTSVALESAEVRRLENSFWPTLMTVGSDADLTSELLAGGSGHLKFKFIHAVLKLITSVGGLEGASSESAVDAHIERTLGLARTTRSAALARMRKMRLIDRSDDGNLSVSPLLIYRMGVLSGDIREPALDDYGLDLLRERERTFDGLPVSVEAIRGRLLVYFYDKILRAMPADRRLDVRRNDILRGVSDANPFGLYALKKVMRQLVREGHLREDDSLQDLYEYGFGENSLISVGHVRDREPVQLWLLPE